MTLEIRRGDMLVLQLPDAQVRRQPGRHSADRLVHHETATGIAPVGDPSSTIDFMPAAACFATIA